MVNKDVYITDKVMFSLESERFFVFVVDRVDGPNFQGHLFMEDPYFVTVICALIAVYLAFRLQYFNRRIVIVLTVRDWFYVYE